VLVRHVDRARDADACAELYAPYVSDGVISLGETPPSAGEMAARIEHVTARFPWLVAELEGEVVGYAYASEHRARTSYRWAADTTVYIASGHRRRGIGRALYRALLPLLVKQGLYVACAGVTLPNEASVGLHESFGFRPVGVYRKIGFKYGQWLDTGWFEVVLREQASGTAPEEPGPPAQLPG
jgi:phosphinothricin acetyltransferase